MMKSSHKYFFALMIGFVISILRIVFLVIISSNTETGIDSVQVQYFCGLKISNTETSKRDGLGGGRVLKFSGTGIKPFLGLFVDESGNWESLSFFSDDLNSISIYAGNPRFMFYEINSETTIDMNFDGKFDRRASLKGRWIRIDNKWVLLDKETKNVIDGIEYIFDGDRWSTQNE